MRHLVLILAVLGSLGLGMCGSAVASASSSGPVPHQTGGQATGTPTAPPTALPTATPTLPSGPTTAFYVLGVRFEHNWAGKDWNVNKTPQKTAKPGTKVQLSVYFNVSAVPTGSTSDLTFTLKRNGKPIYNHSFFEPVPHPANYKWYIKDAPLPTVGTYKLTIRVSLNGITDQSSATIKVTKKG